jgi:hypothetical protein
VPIGTIVVALVVVVAVVGNGKLAVEELEHIVEAFGSGVEGDGVIFIFR